MNLCEFNSYFMLKIDMFRQIKLLIIVLLGVFHERLSNYYISMSNYANTLYFKVKVSYINNRKIKKFDK